MRRLALLAAAAAGLVLAPVRGWAAITAPTQTAGTATGTGNITVAVPSSVSGGIVANDVILAICGSRDAATWSTSSSGWSLVKSFAGTASGIGVFYCRDNGSASCGSLAAVKSTGTGNGRCGTYLFRGVDPTTAVDVAATSATTATASPIAVAAVTTVTNGAVVLSAVDDSNTSATTMTCPGTGVTTSAAFAAFGSSTSRGGNGFCWGTFASAGSTGTQSITFSSVTNLTGFLFALRPTGDATASPAGASATAAAGAVSSSCSGGCPVSIDGGNVHSNFTGTTSPATVPSYTVPSGGYRIVVVSFATSSQSGNDPAGSISGGGVTWSPLVGAHDGLNGGGGAQLWYSYVAGGTTISGASITYTGTIDGTIDVYSIANAGPVQPGATKAVRTNGATAVAFSSSPGLTATQTGSLIVGTIQATNVSTTPAAQSGDAILSGSSRNESNGPEIFATVSQTAATTASTAYGFGVTNTGDVSWGWTVAAAEIVPPVNATVSPAGASATAVAGSLPQPDASASPSGAAATAAAGIVTTGSAVPKMVQHLSSGMNGDWGLTGDDYRFTLPNPVRAGNGLVLGLSYQDDGTGGGRSVTITDDNGNTWPSTPAVTQQAGQMRSSIFVLPNAHAGVTKINLHFGAMVPFVQYELTEFYGIATSSPVNGTCASGTSTNPNTSCGSFTPGNNDSAGGNIIYSYVMDNPGISYTYKTTSLVPTGGATLLAAMGSPTNSADSFASAWQPQAISTTINPGFTVTLPTGSETYNVVGVALKVGPGGTEPPTTGARIVRSMFRSAGAPGSSWPIQFPSEGTLLIAATANGNNLTNITGLSDSAGSSWSLIEAQGDEPQFWHADNTLPSNTRTITASCATGTTVTITFWLVDVLNAHTVDSTGDLPSTNYDPAVNGSIVNGAPVITPGSASGVTVVITGNGLGPTSGFASGAPAGAYFDSTYYTGEVDNDGMNNADGYAHVYNTSTASESFNWIIANGSPYGTANRSMSYFSTAVHLAEALDASVSPAGASATAAAGTVTVSISSSASPSGATATASAGTVTSGVSASSSPAGSSATASAGTTTSTGTASRSPASASATSAAGALTSTGTASDSPAAASATTSAGAVTSTGTAVRSPAVASATAAAGATTSTGTSAATVVGASLTASAGVVTSSGASPGSSFPAAASVTASAGVLASSGTAVRSILGAAATAAAGAVSSSGGGGNGTATIAAAAAVALAGSVSAVTSAVASIAGAAAILAAGILPMNGDLSNAPRYAVPVARPSIQINSARPTIDLKIARPKGDVRF